MRLRSVAATIATLALSVAGLTACGDGGGATLDGAGDPNIIRTAASEPQNGLITTDTNENNGGQVLDLLYRGLVAYDEDGKPRNEVASNIEANSDNTQFTVQLEDGWTFTDGTPVTADSFIDAWNYGAAGKNAQKQQDFFSNIKGFDDVKDPSSSVEKMSGLQKLNDKEFSISLTDPDSQFPISLGATPFYPLPQAFFDDPKGFGEHPVGNGPYKLDGQDAWTHNNSIRTVKNDTYAGDDKPKNGGVTVKLYENLDTAYTDLQANNLDIIGITVPPTAMQTFKDDFPSTNLVKPIAANGGFVIPQWLDHFGNDEEGHLRRQAISMAINRKQIADKIMNGTRVPMKDFTATTLGDIPDVQGKEVLDYNPDKAKELWKKADDIKPFSGKFEIAYNSDGGHKEWVEAVTNSIHNVLGINATGKAYPNFKALRNDVSSGSIHTAFRSGWQGDYPSQVNFLQPQFATDGSSNDGKYTNEEFDNLLKDAARESDPKKAQETYAKAQGILMTDLPEIPLFYYTASAAWTTSLSDVNYDWKGVPIYTGITKN
ncbi:MULTISPECIES: peptide ABC transporter substrate-binding protein [Corynebacterium]|uniref:peptide ABC transporter substrate-binding protein n=1 Tax=Corynebacterium TaxID=1716 RepID=UPI002655584B|nr:MULTISPECIES: ABC transporter substrate-binding protein [Corynebacterium]MDN8624252.1 ABC transporter substrate-binding protein [Corynebacterium kroppenstedtii]